MTTSTTRTTPSCSYGTPECVGALWACQTCHEPFCAQHSHVTSKGQNVECRICELERKQAEIPQAETLPALKALGAIETLGSRLDREDYYHTSTQAK